MTFPVDYMVVNSGISNCYEDQGLLTISSCTVDIAKNWIEFITVNAIELTGATSTDSENFQLMADSAIDLWDTIEMVENIVLST